MEIQRVTRYLDSAMVEEAYRNGIFPMADTDLHIVTWHRPRRRAILPLDAFHVRVPCSAACAAADSK